MISVDGKELAAAAKLLSKVVRPGAIRRIEESVLIEVEDSSMRLGARNGAVDVRLMIDLFNPVEEGFRILVPGELFGKTCAKISDEAAFSLREDGDEGSDLTIQVDGASFVLGVERPNIFHAGDRDLGEPLRSFELGCNDFLGAIRRVSFATADKDTEQGLSGIMLAVVTVDLFDELRIIAADRNVLAMERLQLNTLGEGLEISLSGEFVGAVSALSGSDEIIRIDFHDRTVVVEGGGFSIAGQILNRVPIPYARALREATSFATVAKTDLKLALDRAKIFASKLSPASDLRFKDGELSISSLAKELHSSAQLSMPCDLQGKEVTIRLNSNDLAGVLRALKESDITIGLSAPEEPLRIDEGSFTFVLASMIE